MIEQSVKQPDEASGKRMRAALVGCGQIADAHLGELRKIPGIDIVSVCDRHPELAKQAAARFAVPAVYSDLDRMLQESQPHVLHITTPAQTHAPLARQALAGGVNVYVEKPFTIDVREADVLLAEGERSQRLLCVGHDQLFEPQWLQARQRIQKGELGEIVHVEAMQGYDLSGPFGRSITTDPAHWVLQLPGGLFQNTMSHALYRILDYLPDDEPSGWAVWFSPTKNGAFPSELRVHLIGEHVTASLLFSSTIRPLLRLVRIYGTKGILELDPDGQVTRKVTGVKLPGAFGKLEAPFRSLRDSSRALLGNLWRFVRSDIHYFAGMNQLFRRFYQAVREGGPPPIAYREIRRVTAIMDRIFSWCRENDRVNLSRELVSKANS